MEWFADNPLNCITPLGPAQCIGYVWESENTEWVCRIDATGEVYNFCNEEFRLAATITNGFPDVSPFDGFNEKTARMIERYKKNGWLPS